MKYNSNPPTSGRHFAVPVDDGAYSTAPTDEQLVHNLEHGRVIIWFKPSLPKDTRADLKALFDEDTYQMVLAPRAKMPYQVAASAWNGTPEPSGLGRLLTCDTAHDRRCGTRCARSATSTARTAPSRFPSAPAAASALAAGRSARLRPARNRTPGTVFRERVKRLATLCVPGIALLLFVVAPALSAERWRPDPVDFELAPAQTQVSAARSGRVLSRPLRAPRRFNLVGLRWRGRAEPRLTVRVRRDGRPLEPLAGARRARGPQPDPRSGERSVAASDPLWVGEADQVQYALSRRVPGLRLHFVNVNGTATAGERVTTALRRAANTAVSTVGGGSRRAPTPTPRTTARRWSSRREWGARKCPPRQRPRTAR